MCDYETPLSFHVTSHIAYQPEAEFNITSWNLPANIELADENFFKPTRVDLLIGTEIFFDIMSIGQIKLAPGLPSLQKTLLGWVVSGRYKRPTENASSICLLSVEESVDANLQRLWKLDEPSKADMWTTEQKNCEQSYMQTVQRNIEGRVVVKLPFKEAPHCLGQSYATALRRFIAQERRITRSPDLRQQYIAFMEEYSSLGHMSIVKNVDFDNPHYYVPHHYVLKPTSTTTKLRPKQPVNRRGTKRSILSIASALFDPLGLLAPVIITAKIIIQEIWLLKLNWDESVPQNLQTAWERFLKDIAHLSTLSVPRYCGSTNHSSLQIHGFCDSSIRAYGCAIYLRSKATKGNPTVTLLTAKSRVAPIKKQSLPKLELCGALLLARLLAKIKPLFNANTTVFLWTDSQIVLHWLKMHSATLSTFVGNRVSEIQDLTSDVSWRHVPTKCNPADIVSRGCTALELSRSIWFSGPSFLHLEPENWPTNQCGQLDMEEVSREKRKADFKAVVEENYILKVLERNSTYNHCLRVIAWLFRFHQLTSRPLVTHLDKGTLSPQDLNQALWCIVWNVQQQHFADEIRLINQNKTISGPLKFLNPFLQIHGGFRLLLVGGRLELADLADFHKHPILLPGKCHFVELYIRHLHITHYHAGAKALVALLRLQFWVINARDVARRIVRSCIHCVRYKPKLLQQTMGNLPVSRLTPSRPFARCGIDFCGPVETYLRIRGKTPYKTFIAIFVCFSTKAVHIEIVSDLSTDAFLGALKRMIGRRVLPTDIYCDNATNFVGANRKLHELKMFLFHQKHQESIINYCTNPFINVHFIPPRAPHFGGLWEAAVKSAKGLLNRSVANGRLTFEELNTVMICIEAILNSRPISPLSSDPNDLEALTPGHFLIGSSLKAIPEREEMCTNMDHISKWARTVAIKQWFWRRWSHEYINSLQARTKWTSGNPNVFEGLLVIIQDENAPPQRWTMGRIIKCIAGSDNRIRVVDVKTSRGIFRRPVHKIAILPA